ncbi:MAG: hypothetical protein JNM81_10180 [Rhodospirillaceae bacterium]|nr:hypothetical protein [Rhodospirillaceae bacterium]
MLANETAAVLKNPELYLTANSAAIMRAAAVITGNYTVIPNATYNPQGNISYLRLPNFNTNKTTTATIRILGNTTGRDYGTAIVSSPARSSPQISIQELLTNAGGTSFDTLDRTFTLYLQSTDLLTGVQHVYYSTSSQFFENMSVCSFENGLNYTPLTTQVVNVHTSTLATRFPSTVEVHNRSDQTARLRLRVYDGPTGKALGAMEFDAAANASYSFDSSQIEAAINYQPTLNDFHMNVFVESASAAALKAVISHTVTNVDVRAASLNLTTICSIDF